MKVDLYSRIILTIIAGALLYLCWTSSTPVVKAQEVQRVLITNDQPIPITANSPFSVWIGTANGQPLPVKIVPDARPQSKN